MHKFIQACAGWGKTHAIIERCIQMPTSKRRIIITLTSSGQSELRRRLRENMGKINIYPEVKGWYEFLMHDVISPYLPKKFSNIKISGFDFDKNRENRAWRTNKKGKVGRYFTSENKLIRGSVEELSAEIMLNEASGLVEDRLSHIYDELIIDEVQDISRTGLDVLELLIKQTKLKIFLVGDVRQSLIDSNLQSNKNKLYDRVNLISWFEKISKNGNLKIEYKNVTHRFNQEIANFSDQIFYKNSFPNTVSKQHCEKNIEHKGVYIVMRKDLQDYIYEYNPKLLRHSKACGKNLENLDFKTIGKVKGLSFDHVAILATNPILNFIKHKDEVLTQKSACEFYVAATRARHSVALIVDSLPTIDPSLNIKEWKPKSKQGVLDF
ncbi:MULTISPECIES: AAA family ATPase [Gardnerella]|uniref:AAA family ATPase n=1 Tax=Gardnerella TaxID=2701 RepID=UPI0015738F1D|nr:UvrD-helicase domain-containing protein [Gardnerella vaginalis]